MPFANKFRAMMDFPFAGESLDTFVIELVDVSDTPLGSGRYNYAVSMILKGPGGKQGVRRALKKPFSQHPVTFSGYGNPYQLWFAKPEITSLGERRYQVKIQGAGARIHLEDELVRFLKYVDESGELTPEMTEAKINYLTSTYLSQYQQEIQRKVSRYYRRLAKHKRTTGSE